MTPHGFGQAPKDFALNQIRAQQRLIEVPTVMQFEVPVELQMPVRPARPGPPTAPAAPAARPGGSSGAKAQRLQALESEVSRRRSAQQAAETQRSIVQRSIIDAEQRLSALSQEAQGRVARRNAESASDASLEAQRRKARRNAEIPDAASLDSLVEAESRPLKEVSEETAVARRELEQEESKLEHNKAEVKALWVEVLEATARLQATDKEVAETFMRWHRTSQELEALQLAQRGTARRITQTWTRLSGVQDELSKIRSQSAGKAERDIIGVDSIRCGDDLAVLQRQLTSSFPIASASPNGSSSMQSQLMTPLSAALPVAAPLGAAQAQAPGAVLAPWTWGTAGRLPA